MISATIQDRPRNRSLTLGITCVAFGAIVCVIPWLPFKAEVAGALVFVLVPLAWAVWRKLRGEFDWFELFLIFSVLNFAYFGVGAIWLKTNPTQLVYVSLRPYISAALWVGVLGFVSAAAGYAVLGARVRPSRLARMSPSGSKFYVAAAVVGSVGQTAAIAQERLVAIMRAEFSPVASTFQQLSPVMLFAWALMWQQFWSGALNRAQKWLLFGAMVPFAVVIVVGFLGSKETVIIWMSFPAIAYWYARRQLPWRTLVTCLLIGVFVIFPLYNTYRNQSTHLASDERMSRAVDVAAQWDRKHYLDQSVNAFMNRISLVYCVGAILRDVPEAVPYRYGETLALLPIGLLVPRIVWPDKPNIVIGREFGVTFQLVSPVDEITQVSPTMTGELYWNFDIPGVVLGMFLFGGVMRSFYERFASGTRADPLRRACYLGMLPIAIHFEGNAAAMLGGLIKSLLILWIFTEISRRMGWIVESPSLPEGAPGPP